MSLEKHQRYSFRKLKFGLASVAVAAFLSGTAGLAQADETSADEQGNNTPVAAQTGNDQENQAQADTEQNSTSQTAVAPTEVNDQPETAAPASTSETSTVIQPAAESAANPDMATMTLNPDQVDGAASSEADLADSKIATETSAQTDKFDAALDNKAVTADVKYKNTFVDDGQGNWYYLDNNGNNVTGRQDINGQRLYFAQDGKQVKGQEATIDGKVYYFDRDSGELWVNRFRQADDQQGWFYYGSDGARVVGSQEVGGQKLYFDPTTGKQAKGRLITDSDGKIRYYDQDSGNLWTDRFAQIDGSWYYFGSDGAAATGAQTINGKDLYFNADGSQVKGGLIQVDGKTHYYDENSGQMLRNTSLLIDGVTYRFDNNGDGQAQDKVQVVKTSIVVDSYEFGPSVSKIILQFDHKVTPSVIHNGASVMTAGVARQVLNSYVSDATGHVVYFDSSNYVTLELNIPYDSNDTGKNASPFNFDMATFSNKWASAYNVKVDGLSVQYDGSVYHQNVASEQNAIANRVIPETERFSERATYGDFHYAAYTPENAKAGEKNPLIIWLHGIGEVGTDVDIPILASNAVNLTEDPIQSHFTSTGKGTQKGAYVMVLQSPTSWEKADKTQVMAAIRSYVAAHPDIDSNRIYLAGASNGGGMTWALAAAYPNYFAALVPISAPYDVILTNNNNNIKVDVQAALRNQPMWLISSKADATLDVDNHVLPFYKDMLQAGGQNKWLSYFETNVGEFANHPTYNGHWSWVYFMNDQVTGVQNATNAENWAGLTGMVPTNATHGGDAQAVYKGKNYANIFDWMNAQNKKNRKA
ncbi:glucan-binding protein D [Streptococcus criceti]|uniref:Uncharacterized protein n=2 Tax=Streptococcus criceti TaxID=1333 RepID=G5JT92_STRCG|nr:YSIRK-type signal peptide-containing protein [Streptococcus criceti]EHI74294.1 hypothetical protein STRCR_1060 [Streptococcus criceti HS-6]BAM76972.1 glucan-binding protein D [Streptococcus criceti]BAM76974.1 glucan-binding protein D [Streptococcus criceti]SUN37634.1 glucan-binding protein D [Streptococcus criceti]